MRTFINDSIHYISSNKKVLFILATLVAIIYYYPEIKSGFSAGWEGK